MSSLLKNVLRYLIYQNATYKHSINIFIKIWCFLFTIQPPDFIFLNILLVEIYYKLFPLSSINKFGEWSDSLEPSLKDWVYEKST